MLNKKRKVLLTDSEDDFVEMAKTWVKQGYLLQMQRNYFLFVFSGLGRKIYICRILSVRFEK